MRPALNQHAPAPPPRLRPALRGFTLIELLVVLTIIVILLSLAAGGLIMATTGAQQKETRIRLHALASLASEYKVRTGNVVNPIIVNPAGVYTAAPVPGNTYNIAWGGINNYFPFTPAPTGWRWPSYLDWAANYNNNNGYPLGVVVCHKAPPPGDNRTYQSLQPANINHPPADPASAAWWEYTPAYRINIQRFCAAVWQIPDLQTQLLALGKGFVSANQQPGQTGLDIMEVRDAWGMFIDYRVDAAGNAYFVSAGADGFFGADGDGNHSVDNLDSRQIK